MLGLGAEDWGELAAWTILGAAAGCLLVWAFIRSRASDRRLATLIGILAVTLAFFAVVLDMTHVAFRPNKFVDEALTIVEDGGEMLAISSSCAFVCFVARNYPLCRSAAERGPEIEE